MIPFVMKARVKSREAEGLWGPVRYWDVYHPHAGLFDLPHASFRNWFAAIAYANRLYQVYVEA